MTASLILWRPASRLFQLALALAAWHATARAQETAPPDTPPQESVPDQPTAPVVLDGVALFRVRGVAAYPATQRADAIAERMAAVASDRTILVESLTVREAPQASVLTAAG